MGISSVNDREIHQTRKPNYESKEYEKCSVLIHPQQGRGSSTLQGDSSLLDIIGVKAV